MVTLLSYFSATLFDLATYSICNELIDAVARARYKKSRSSLDFEPVLTSLVWKPGWTMSPCGRRLSSQISCYICGKLQDSTFVRNWRPTRVLQHTTTLSVAGLVYMLLPWDQSRVLCAESCCQAKSTSQWKATSSLGVCQAEGWFPGESYVC